MTANAHSESEAETRRQRIDPKLAACGWTVIRYAPGLQTGALQAHAVAEYPTANGPADYALVVSGQELGVVEGKRLTLGPQNVLTQAERYSRGAEGSPFDFDGFRIPFLYSTNGEVTWFHDVRHELSRSRRIAGFHTPAALREMMGRDTAASAAAHTKAYFRDVVYRYEYERAVREGFLVDYDAVRIRSEVRLKGVFLQEGEQVGAVDTRTGLEKLDELEDERGFPSAEIEHRITAPDSNRKIIQELRTYCDQHEQRWNRFPKTLIFAVNDLPHTSHADQLVDICRDVFGRGDSFVQKITGRADRPLQRIREFRNRPSPGIVVTVDMLSTGVDIPDLEFIVMLRPVKSRILFEQMLGRGTRRGEHFPDKSHFTVFDCFDGTVLEYFRQSTAITAEPPDRPTRSIVGIIEDIWANRDRAYNVRCLTKRLLRIDKEMAGEARTLFAQFIPDGDLASFARDLPGRLAADFTGTMALLRAKAFLELLQNYPRQPRVFYVAYNAEDQVSSEWLVRDGAGHEYKPADYLAEFARFVRENAERVQAIGILLERPRDWGTDALADLRRTLSAAPQRFSEETLRRAHDVHYHKALVDIISMVKHAAREQEALLTAEERVGRALQALRAGRTFTPEQEEWLEFIRRHLVVNLSIDRGDFEVLPVFTQRGGLGRARKVFGSQLDELIRRLNEAVAA